VSDLLEANLRVLRARDPARAAAIVAASDAAPALALEMTPEGQPTLSAAGVLLHSRHAPVREAASWATRQLERCERGSAETAVVLGFGLGYHLEWLAPAWPGRIVVVEPDDAVLRAAFTARDLRNLLERVELAPSPLTNVAIAGWGSVLLLPHGPSLLRDVGGLRALKERIAGRALLSGLALRIMVVSPLYGGSHPIAGYCARALAEMGHTVTLLDLAPFAAGMQAVPMFTGRAAARRAVEESYMRFLGDGVLAAVDAVGPDLVLALAQAPLMPSVLEEIGKRGVLRAFWFVEDHRLMTYWKDVAGAYDHFFTIQEGDFLAEVARLTSDRARYLPCAADPAVHRPLTLSPEEWAALGARVAFVGAGYRNRRFAFRSLLDLGLKIWGSEWQDAEALGTAVQRDGARIVTEETVRIFNATAVNLNLHSSTYVDGVDPRGDFVNPRTFELAAAGAFQLVDMRSLLPPLFHPGTELATFTDAAALRDLVQHWLGRPEERAAIAAAGRARVLAEHTYRHRMETLLEAVCARDSDRLRGRARHRPTVAEAAVVERATPLGDLLGRLPASTPFTLNGVASALAGREGDMSDPERILLFLHQFDELYLREHRQ
jgi:spore maturation protein CgeB